MIDHTLLLPDGILVLEPKAPLEAADFAAVAAEVDPYIAEHGELNGVMLHAKAFPGWSNLDAALAHLRFVKDHHHKIRRLAVVSDSTLLRELPKITGKLLHPEVKQFAESAQEQALQWLRQDANRQ